MAFLSCTKTEHDIDMNMTTEHDETEHCSEEGLIWIETSCQCGTVHIPCIYTYAQELLPLLYIYLFILQHGTQLDSWIEQLANDIHSTQLLQHRYTQSALTHLVNCFDP